MVDKAEAGFERINSCVENSSVVTEVLSDNIAFSGEITSENKGQSVQQNFVVLF